MTHMRPQAITIVMYKVKNGLPPYITDLLVVTSSTSTSALSFIPNLTDLFDPLN